MKKTTTLQFLTRTAMLLALAIIFQNLRYLIPAGPQSTLIIGSLVNLCIVVATGAVGIASGVIISLITPLVALLQAHLPHPFFAPVTAIGNMAIAFVMYLSIKTNIFAKVSDFTGVIIGAFVKWGVMYFLGISLVLNTIIPKGTLKPPQVAALSANFNLPQLITALIGGVLGVVIVRILIKSRAVKQ